MHPLEQEAEWERSGFSPSPGDTSLDPTYPKGKASSSRIASPKNSIVQGAPPFVAWIRTVGSQSLVGLGGLRWCTLHRLWRLTILTKRCSHHAVLIICILTLIDADQHTLLSKALPELEFGAVVPGGVSLPYCELASLIAAVMWVDHQGLALGPDGHIIADSALHRAWAELRKGFTDEMWLPNTRGARLPPHARRGGGQGRRRL